MNAPAMVKDSAPCAEPVEEDDSDWEYEYHETETEVGSQFASSTRKNGCID